MSTVARWSVYGLLTATATLMDAYFRAWWVFVLLGLYVVGMVALAQRQPPREPASYRRYP